MNANAIKYLTSSKPDLKITKKIEKLIENKTPISDHERREHLVSGAYGLSDIDSGITKDDIRKELNSRYGKIG